MSLVIHTSIIPVMFKYDLSGTTITESIGKYSQLSLDPAKF